MKSGNRDLTDHLLRALDVAVPFWSLRVRGLSDDEALLRVRAAGAIVAHYGDALQYAKGRETHRSLIDLWVRQHKADPGNLDAPWKGSPSPGEVFNALAEGIALAERVCPGQSRQLFDLVAMKRPLDSEGECH